MKDDHRFPSAPVRLLNLLDWEKTDDWPVTRKLPFPTPRISTVPLCWAYCIIFPPAVRVTAVHRPIPDSETVPRQAPRRCEGSSRF